MRMRAIAGGAILWLGLAFAPSASAEILFLTGASHVEAHASAFANGVAYAVGEEAEGTASMNSSSSTHTSSLDQGLDGSTSYGLGQAQADFTGSSQAITGTTEIDAYEQLAALASDSQDMRVEFASPSSASFFFTGEASASFSRVSYTTVSSVPATSAGAQTLAGPKGTKPRPVKPKAVVDGSAGAKAESDNSYTYTFEALGQFRQTLTIAYLTSALIDGPVEYELSLVNAKGGRVGPTRFIDANADGEASWRLRPMGVYSLIVSEISRVNATDNFGDVWSQGAFQMSVSADDPRGASQTSLFADGSPPDVSTMSAAAGWSPDASAVSAAAAVPELPAWALFLIGLAGLQSARTLRPLAMVSAAARGGRGRDVRRG